MRWTFKIAWSVTRDRSRGELQKNALWLLNVLSWIPKDRDSVMFVENLSLRSEVFETALKAERDAWPEGYDCAWKMIMNWAIEGGQFLTGWGTLERWLSALCALALRGEINRSEILKTQLSARLAAPDAPCQDLRDRAARDLREKAHLICNREFEMDLVERMLAANEHQQTKQLLREVADILAP